MNKTAYTLPFDLGAGIANITGVLKEYEIVDHIWAKDPGVWTDNGEENWLGWLDIVDRMSANIDSYKQLAAEINAVGFDNIVLMGMGGSSLCPEVLAKTFGNERFYILDSTVPAQVISLHKKINPEKALFIVASKSGSTLEPNCFFAYFFDVVSKIIGSENAGSHFIAITDPGSKMEQAARDNGFRHIIHGEPTVGGRFSALSPFGLTAAALIGYDLESFLAKASEMIELCRRTDPMDNPGAVLGTYLGACQAMGRDKLTIFTSEKISTFGAWLEQLIAESTGKNGLSIIPVDGEPLSSDLYDKYGNDRAFAFISVRQNDAFAEAEQELYKRGHPSVSIIIDDEYDLAAEFFRWEFATAVAGSIMRINPFDQPDVEAAKIEARKLTDEYESTGSLPSETPFFSTDSLSFYNIGQANADLASIDNPDMATILGKHLSRIGNSDYFALLGYVEMSNEAIELLRSICNKILETSGTATCLGFGPRFLHSTGQAYKGGPNTGVFLQITSDDPQDIGVPGREITFGVVKNAQARGDLQVLADRGRRALRIHINGDVADGLKQILSVL